MRFFNRGSVLILMIVISGCAARKSALTTSSKSIAVMPLKFTGGNPYTSFGDVEILVRDAVENAFRLKGYNIDESAESIWDRVTGVDFSLKDIDPQRAAELCKMMDTDLIVYGTVLEFPETYGKRSKISLILKAFDRVTEVNVLSDRYTRWYDGEQDPILLTRSLAANFAQSLRAMGHI